MFQLLTRKTILKSSHTTIFHDDEVHNDYIPNPVENKKYICAQQQHYKLGGALFFFSLRAIRKKKRVTLTPRIRVRGESAWGDEKNSFKKKSTAAHIRAYNARGHKSLKAPFALSLSLYTRKWPASHIKGLKLHYTAIV